MQVKKETTKSGLNCM